MQGANSLAYFVRQGRKGKSFMTLSADEGEQGVNEAIF
jgi:hypothetical protein